MTVHGPDGQIPLNLRKLEAMFEALRGGGLSAIQMVDKNIYRRLNAAYDDLHTEFLDRFSENCLNEFQNSKETPQPETNVEMITIPRKLAYDALSGLHYASELVEFPIRERFKKAFSELCKRIDDTMPYPNPEKE